MFNIPSLINNNTFIFNYVGDTYQPWIKPQGCRFIEMICLGGGGGGGGGYASTSGVTRFGGVGGGSSSITRSFFAANQLPDTLYINVGGGGIGGTGGTGNLTTLPTSGASGELSYITIIPDITQAINIVCVSGTIPPTGGAAGGLASPTAGAAGTVATFASGSLMALGNFTTFAGQAAAAAGANITMFNASINTGGSPGVGLTGGGGIGAGGAVTGSLIFPTLAANAGAGLNNLFPFYSTTGAGGTANNSGNASNGGKSGFGSGGAGGGVCGGGGVFTAGNGSDGGNGIVIITTY